MRDRSSCHLRPAAPVTEVVIIEGNAAISERRTNEWLPAIGAAYGAKYADGLRGQGMTLEQMVAQYDHVIVVNTDTGDWVVAVRL